VRIFNRMIVTETLLEDLKAESSHAKVRSGFQQTIRRLDKTGHYGGLDPIVYSGLDYQVDHNRIACLSPVRTSSVLHFSLF
jgi:hypothetical protein